MQRKERVILHVDMDAFFAAVEIHRRPQLRGQPLIIGGHGDPKERGVVSTASYEARRFGVHSGMPLRTAWTRCPQCIFLPVDYPAYAEVSRRIHRILQTFSHRTEVAGLDEAYIDLTGDPQPERTARRIKARVAEATGLSCSVGIGPNKLLAKLASDLEKPDGLTRLRHEDLQTRIWPLPVIRLWGVGPKTAARLARRAIHTIGQLAATPLDTLVAELGAAHGRALHLAARGVGDEKVVAHHGRKSLGRETTFAQDISGRAPLERTLALLIRSVVARMRQYHYRARGVTLKIRFADFETVTRSMTLPTAVQESEAIGAAARALLDRCALEKPVRLLGIRVNRLQTQAPTRPPSPR